MGYKKINWNMTFAAIALMTAIEHNRSLKMMEKIKNKAFRLHYEAFRIEMAV